MQRWSYAGATFCRNACHAKAITVCRNVGRPRRMPPVYTHIDLNSPRLFAKRDDLFHVARDIFLCRLSARHQDSSLMEYRSETGTAGTFANQEVPEDHLYVEWNRKCADHRNVGKWLSGWSVHACGHTRGIPVNCREAQKHAQKSFYTLN